MRKEEIETDDFGAEKKFILHKAKKVIAYFHMQGKDADGNPKFGDQIDVLNYAVYPRYLKEPSDKSGFDFAIAAIKFLPEKVAVSALNAKFNTVPSITRNLEKGHKILVTIQFFFLS